MHFETLEIIPTFSVRYKRMKNIQNLNIQMGNPNCSKIQTNNYHTGMWLS